MAKTFAYPHQSNPEVRPPGSLSYTGEHKDVAAEIEIIRYTPDTLTEEVIHSVDELPLDFPDDTVTWINLTGLNDPKLISEFGRRFLIHEMHLEDIVQVNRHAKVEMQDHYLMTEHYMIYNKDKLYHESVTLLLLKNVVLSFQEYPGDVFEPIRERLRQAGSKLRQSKEDYLYYQLVDRLVDEAVVVLKDLVFQLDDMERQLLDVGEIDMRRAYQIKRELLDVKTAIYPLDGLFDILLGERNQVISHDVLPYMKDVEDHVDLAIVQIGRAMDTIENMNQSSMAKLSNQMNSIMKVLTIFSAIFIPLNFITGMYGMNFRHMPFLDHPYAFFGFIGSAIIIVMGLVWYFKRKQWF